MLKGKLETPLAMDFEKRIEAFSKNLSQNTLSRLVTCLVMFPTKIGMLQMSSSVCCKMTVGITLLKKHLLQNTRYTQ